MHNSEQKDKTNFALGLFAASLAMLILKDDLANIYIPMGNQKAPLLGAVVIFILFLAIAVYLYALDFTRFSFGKYKDSWPFRWITPTANFFYSISIFFPLLVLFMSIFSVPPLKNFAIKYYPVVWAFDSVMVIAWLVVSIINTKFRTKKG